MDKYIINNHVEGDPLDEKNLDKVLNLVHEIRLSIPNKTIWLYSGFMWETIFNYETPEGLMKRPNDEIFFDYLMFKRKEIISKCNVLVDGQYIDSKRNITLKWRGSSNQRVINIEETLKQNKIVLWCE